MLTKTLYECAQLAVLSSIGVRLDLLDVGTASLPIFSYLIGSLEGAIVPVEHS